LSSAASSSLWWLDNSASKRHFCNIDIDGNILTMKAMDASHNIFDELVLDKGTAGIRPVGNNGNIIYPNPSNGLFTVAAAGQEILGYRIFNSTGQIISEVPIHLLHSSQIQIDISDHAEGIYYAEIRTTAGTSIAKLIKY